MRISDTATFNPWTRQEQIRSRESVEILAPIVLRPFLVPAVSLLSHVFIRNMLPRRSLPEQKNGSQSDGRQYFNRLLVALNPVETNRAIRCLNRKFDSVDQSDLRFEVVPTREIDRGLQRVSAARVNFDR